MKFEKWDRLGSNNLYTSSKSVNKEPQTIPSGGNNGLNRVLWGNDDSGGDITDNMYVYGSVYVNRDTLTEEWENAEFDTDEEEPQFDFEPREDDEGGNLYVQFHVDSSTAEIKEAYTHVLKYEYNDNPEKDLSEHQAAQDTSLINHEGRLGYLESLFPIGSIIMYAGNAAIPRGWHICDGTGGTVNLVNRFIKGGTTAGATGGSSTATFSVSASLPAHYHYFKNYLTQVNGNGEIYDQDDGGRIEIGGRVLSVGKEKANRDPTKRAQTSDSGYSDIPYILNSTELAGDNSSSSNNTQTINIEPPYYTLIFIQRIS